VGGMSSQPEKEGFQAMVESISPKGKMRDGERHCKVHFMPFASQLFILSRPLKIFFLFSRSAVPNKTKQRPFDLCLVQLCFPHKQNCRDCGTKDDRYKQQAVMMKSL